MDNDKAFQHLFKKYQPIMVSYSIGFVKQIEDAKEVVQDVFINIWHHRERLVFDDNLKSYLFTATKNKSLNFLQKKKLNIINAEIADVQHLFSTGTSEDELFANELRVSIFKQVDLLPKKCREIFILSREDGLSYKEIAERLDISIKTVETQISIALKRLRANIFDGNGRQKLFSFLLIIFFLLCFKGGSSLCGIAN